MGNGTVLVTGAAGMIGSHLVQRLAETGYTVVGIDRKPTEYSHPQYTHIVGDSGDAETLAHILDAHPVERVIHLAALAHTAGAEDLSEETYYRINVTGAETVFRAAGERPLLFISTADVYGFADKPVDASTPLHPVTVYGKTKAQAEQLCRELCRNYTIFRLQPVYTPTVKRDIQKRYYLHYPNWAYQVGKGSAYEVLAVEEAVRQMAEWVENSTAAVIRNIKDPCLMQTTDCIRAEKEAGRATHVLKIPRFLPVMGVWLLRALTGRNRITFLLNKVVHPLYTK